MMHNTKEMEIEVGDVVLIKVEEKNKRKCSIEILRELFKDKDDVMCGVKVQTPKSQIERPIQYLHRLEVHSNMETSTSQFKNTSHKKLNVDAKEYRPPKTAAGLDEMCTSNIVAEQSDE